MHWYFDFISPYAYLQFAAHPDLFERSDVVLRPVVFAGLLNHWGHKGPAEIPAKRIHTFRQTTWLAQERGVPFKCPPSHPFNPLHVLRLATALGATRDVVGTIFQFIWGEGRDPNVEWEALCARLQAPLAGRGATEFTNSDTVKLELRANGEAALAVGVFGVPTFVAGTDLFWGEEATPLLRAYLTDPAVFDTAEMRRVTHLPAAAVRKA